jgi:hypothetical protein
MQGEHAHHEGEQCDQHERADDQRDLVVLAERADGEGLDRLRGEGDDDVAHRHDG